MVVIQSLPAELLTHVFFFVDPKTLANVCSQVCSLWNNFITDLGKKLLPGWNFSITWVRFCIRLAHFLKYKNNYIL
jgi:hypothetical protein